MSTVATEALDRGAVPWLFASALVTTAPHFEHQPDWLSAFAGLTLAGAGWLWWKGARLPGRWLLILCVIVGSAGILFEFRTLFGRDAGVALLVMLMALKVLELRSRRDAYVLVTLAYFLLLTHYFYSQSIPTGLWLLTASLVVTATLIRLHGGSASAPLPTLRYAGWMTIQAVPFMLVLYLLFPRVAGPLWGLPQDAHSSRSGLTDTMAPGTIANLAQSGEIAFRARFEGPAPRQDKLYWRGPVMEDYDGLTWRQQWLFGGTTPVIEARGAPVRYSLTLEAHNQRWLLALDAPTTLPPEARLARTLTVLGNRPVQHRQRFEFGASTDYRFNVGESSVILERNLRLPAQGNPRTRALAEEWRRTDPRPEQLVQKALGFFRNERFVYTLQPPLLGPDAMDDFLFNTRRGFCEHYASAFVVLMRAAGVPARVVGGYQGGDLNPVDGYLIVRQSDAHAWAEIWQPEQGWMRVDPTAAVSPARVETGIVGAVPAGDPLPGFIQIDTNWIRALRYRWEAFNNGWNQWVLGYNSDRQRELLSRLGFAEIDWRTLAGLLVGTGTLVLAMISAWTLYRRPRLDPARRLWSRALRQLRRRGITCHDWEAPLALAKRLGVEKPEIGAAMNAVATAYCAVRYGREPADIEILRRAVKALPGGRIR
ncbi:MAG: DUF3488 and DUF4129 domain-containing transglutaminase family protein [Betaproteobacteria bacterium]